MHLLMLLLSWNAFVSVRIYVFLFPFLIIVTLNFNVDVMLLFLTKFVVYVSFYFFRV
ncbi:hypothetical protein MKW92_042163 [Papaver armeniacum]|nr:hypothetical protein MKW92_042163 [Papaver armeniacum]